MSQCEEEGHKLTCPNCGNTGIAQFEEHRDPTYPGLSILRIQSLSEGFNVRGGQHLRERVIFCTGCDTDIPESSF